MISFKDAILEAEKKQGKQKSLPQRTALLKELYEFYERDYGRMMRKQYFIWLGNRKHNESLKALFMKTPSYRKKITPKSFASFWLSHIPTPDLYYLISIAKDKEARRESFNRWLFWALKPDLSQTLQPSVIDSGTSMVH